MSPETPSEGRQTHEFKLADVLDHLDPSTRTDRSAAERLRQLFQWPPDLFAFTSTVFALSGCYRRVFSPPPGQSWPPSARWAEAVAEQGKLWMKQIDEAASASEAALPSYLEQSIPRLTAHLHHPLSFLDTPHGWPLFLVLFTLHATADHACAGAGIPTPSTNPRRLGDALRNFANLLLTSHGSMSTFATSRVRVLPKMRTPQVGATLRSLSHHLAVDRTEVCVDVMRHTFVEGPEERLNLLVLPWPKQVTTRDFRPCPKKGRGRSFSFQPAERLNKAKRDEFTAAVRTASDRFGQVHGIVMPESALTLKEADELQRMLIGSSMKKYQVRMLLTGVRDQRRNYARLSIYDDSALRWLCYDQAKHHRWRIDAGQIRQYHIGASLHPESHWWEDIDIEPRRLNLLFANEWLALCHLICEDLARAGPGIDLIRAVGPTLLIALLLDGPQLASRWPARYATTLADDPGTSVLTVSSLGMVERSRPDGIPRSRVVALWKDSVGGARELSLDPGASGLFLSLTARRVREDSADGRHDGGLAAVLELSGVEQIVCGSASGPSRARTRKARAKGSSTRSKQAARQSRR